MKSKIDTSEKVDNKERKFGSSLEYFPCLIDDNKALFTKNELDIAIERANKNLEDFEEDGFLSWLFK